jgi:hypothetical protein
MPDKTAVPCDRLGGPEVRTSLSAPEELRSSGDVVESTCPPYDVSEAEAALRTEIGRRRAGGPPTARRTLLCPRSDASADGLDLRGFDRDVMTALHAWAYQNDLAITIVERLSGGFTLARLYSAYVEGPTIGVRKIVVKALPPIAGLDREPSRHLKALRSEPDFARRHLVSQAFAPVPLAGGGWLLFLSVAGGSLHNSTTLAGIASIARERYRLQTICPAIISDVLGGWNPDCTSQSMTTRAFLASAIGAHGRQYGAKLAPLVPSQLRIDLPGEPQLLPNPIALADGRLRTSWRPRCLIGRRHGDLHAGNIVVPRTADEDGEEFWMIDFSVFERHGLLAIDPCFLAATLAIGWLDELDGYAQSDMIDLIIDPDRAGARRVAAPLRNAVLSIGRAGLDWATADGRGLGDDWLEQIRLACVACGIIMAAREPVPDRHKMWCIRLAARAAHHLGVELTS